MHDGIADKHRLKNQGGVNLGFGGDFNGQCIDRLAHGAGHFLISARIHHGIGDAAHQVFAKADLRVHDARGGQDTTIGQIAQMGSDSG